MQLLLSETAITASDSHLALYSREMIELVIISISSLKLRIEDLLYGCDIA